MLTALWGEPENGQKCDPTYVCDYKIHQARILIAFRACFTPSITGISIIVTSLPGAIKAYQHVDHFLFSKLYAFLAEWTNLQQNDKLINPT